MTRAHPDVILWARRYASNRALVKMYLDEARTERRRGDKVAERYAIENALMWRQVGRDLVSIVADTARRHKPPRPSARKTTP